jgi:uncharacterized protein YabE (DUF348 family)
VLLVILLVVFALLIVGGLYVVTAQPVVLVIEGVRRDVRTRQTTVAGVLDELDVFIEDPDRVSPAPETVLTPGMQITIDKAHPVIIDADGQRLRVLTHNSTPADILREFGLSLGEGDALYVDGAPADPAAALETLASLRIQRAITVHIVDADDDLDVRTAGRTVGEALAQAGVTLFLADVVTPPLDALIDDGATVIIRRSWPISVQVDGRVLNTRSAAATVGAALADAGVALVGLDYTIPAEDAPTVPNMSIRVVRVTETDEVERTEIAYRQVVQTDTSIAPDTQRIIQPGQSGIRERRVRIRLEDGVEVSRSEPREAVVRDPQDEIIAVGARPSLMTTPTPAATQPDTDS